MDYLGYFPYRTALSYPVGFDAQHARQHPFRRDLDAQKLEQFIASRQKDNARYRKVIETFNPPEVFVRAGHQLGMKVVFWLDIFDDGYSGHRSKFIDEHPHCQWTARDGKTHFQGLVSYAWPESRALRVAQAKELLELGADGTVSHRMTSESSPQGAPGGSGCFREVAELAEETVGGKTTRPQEPMPSFSSLFAFRQAIFSYAT